MTALPAITEPFALEDQPVSAEILAEIERFYYREARLLDAERYEEWLDQCIDRDILYWMPDMDTRRRDDPRGTYAHGECAYFDDSYAELSVRVKRFGQPSAWADNPATRHLHMISNVEAYETGRANLIGAFSAWMNVRNRNETDQDILHGRREDILRRTETGLKVVRRRIFTVQNVLLTKNLNTFL